MKQCVILLSLISFFLFGCSKNLNKNQNVPVAKLIQDVKWDYNYEKIKDLLENKYGLEFDNEIEQTKKYKNRNSKVFAFEGAKLNEINTWRWNVSFENDSLFDVVITIGAGPKEKSGEIIQKLKDAINELPYTKFTPLQDEWILEWVLEQNDTPIGRIQITDFKNGGLAFSYSTDKLLRNYKYK